MTTFARAAAADQPVDACGLVVRYVTCTVFEPDGGGAWFTPQSAMLPVGQRGRVVGMLDTGCTAACPVSQGCLVNFVFHPTCRPACRADFDQSGTVGVQDLFEFLEAFFGGVLGPSPPGGDFDQSGVISVQDIFEFLAAWFIGCP